MNNLAHGQHGTAYLSNERLAERHPRKGNDNGVAQCDSGAVERYVGADHVSYRVVTSTARGASMPVRVL